jgi:hypothetical protein
MMIDRTIIAILIKNNHAGRGGTPWAISPLAPIMIYELKANS